MSAIESITLEVSDATAAEVFYKEAFELGDTIKVRESQEPTNGFRGFTLSLVVSQPSTVDSLVESALGAGATELKPVKKSFWGYGGVLQAPDGTIWKIATSSKKETGPPTRAVDEVVLLLGVEDVKATKQFYVDRGLAVGKSFGSKYVEFETLGSAVKLALYSRRAAAKDAGVPPEGSGSHRVVVHGDGGQFTDPDGFLWEAQSV
jgi:predicted lactoylglutathione lyase